MTRRTVALAILGFVLAVAGAAAAYWTRPVVYGCTACAVADAASLSTPSVSATVRGAGRIDLAWTSAATQPVGTTYRITRTGGGSSPQQFSSTGSSFRDTSVAPGTSYQYAVVAVVGTNWVSSSGVADATTPAGVLSVGLSATAVDAGSSLAVSSITAMVGGTTDATVNGSRTIEWTGLVASPGGDAPRYPGGSTSQTVTFVDGVATLGSTFTTYASGNRQLTATLDSMSGSATFTVRPLAASRWWLSGASSVAAGVVAAVSATAQDIYGNTVAATGSGVTFSKLSGSGTVSGLGAASAVNGVATISVTGNVAGDLVLQAAGGGLTAGTRTLSVTGHAAASKLTLSGATSVSAGNTVTWSATVQDAYGNTVAAGANPVVFAKASGSGTLVGLGSVTPVNGVASITLTGGFAGSLSVDVSSAGLPTLNRSVTVSGYSTPGAVVLTGTGTVAAGATVTLNATVQDAYGNNVPNATSSIQFTKASGSGTLGGLGSVTAVNGVASLVVTGNLAGDVVVQASSTGLSSATYTVTVTGYAAAAKLGITGAASVEAGQSVALTVAVQDTYGNTVGNATNRVQLSRAAGPGTVTGTGTRFASSGTVTFTITGNVAGTVTLNAASTGLTSGTFTLTVTGWSTAASTVITGGSAVSAGAAISMSATVVDGYGNAVGDATTPITFVAASGPGTLVGYATVNAVDGTASISLTGGLAGSVTLQSTAAGLTADSHVVVVSGYAAAAKLVASGAATVNAGGTVTVTATVQDTYGNNVTDAANVVTFSKSAGSGTMSGFGSVTASSGVATITLTGNVAGSLSVQASSPGLTSASQTLTVSGYGAASKIAVSGSVAQHAYTATVQDAWGNTVSGGASAALTITFSKASGAGTVSGLTSAGAVNGVATITGVNPGVAGSIVIQASASASSGAISGTLTDTVRFDLSTVSCNATNGKCTFSGGGALSTNGTISVTVCSTNSFPCATPVATVSAAAVNGTWTTGASGALGAGTYYAQAKQGTVSTGGTVLTFMR